MLATGNGVNCYTVAVPEYMISVCRSLAAMPVDGKALIS
jgi:hypothetical protein